MKLGKAGLLILIAALVAGFFLFGLDDELTLANLKARQAELDALLAARPALLIGGFFILYVAVAALSLPGAAIMTIAAGAIFGLLTGTIIVSFASSIGASLAFLASRYLLRDWVKARFSKAIAAIDRGMERDGIFYLLTLRLVPAFPFFLVNLAMGLTAMRLVHFYLVSQAGMLAGTIVFVNAGTQLARVESADDIFSPWLVGSFVALGLFPLAAKFILDRVRRARLYRGYRRPRRFDRNLIVIGAGAGGLVTSYVAAQARARVTLIEAGEMGGDCLNTGCVPSKTLIRSARLAHEMRHADRHGLPAHAPEVTLKEVMARVREAIGIIAPADSAERYESLGVDVRRGHARVVDPWTVEIDGQDRLTARAIVLATGGEPAVPPIPGIEEAGYLTSDTMWDALAGRDEMPGRIAIIGGGPIGCEMAQAFARLGAKVTLIDHGDRLLKKEDGEVSSFAAETLRGEGVDLRLGHQIARAAPGKLIVEKTGGERGDIAFDELLIAAGRKARLSGYGLEELGIETDGTIVTDRLLRTRFPNIHAVGDAAGPYQFTHFAAHQAWHAAVNALFGAFKRFAADYSALPRVTYMDPEIAHVGHNEQSAQDAGLAYEVVRYELSHLDRAVTEGARAGFVKLLVPPGKDRILGATIVAEHGGELIAEMTLAMKYGLGLKKILATIHAYPTMAEANRYAAGEWRKAHKPERLLALAERYHRWRRG
ncbi:MAG: FAD-dependent oxidoreductase [Sphingomonadaceae bacterium]